ncbi:MAG: branched-chain amino acid ABC transporter permease [Proteobacteria bacterium]|nr:branched-chain amino acid ABC transporter permease [Pseudomonadota bacterium]NIS72641.1 branched-chain amino acid ABC transporter permease [Pseudomonadota bacterium]
METARPETIAQPVGGPLISFAPYIAIGGILIIVPPFLSTYFQGIMTRFLIFAIFTMGYNVAFGYTGLISLGHAAFFGVGGYTIAVLKLQYGSDLFWIGFPLGILVAAVIAALFGIIALRVSGLYFLLVTFALGQLLYSIAWNVKWLNSPGMQGIAGLSLPSFGIPGFVISQTSFYYLVLLISVICFGLVYRIVHSPLGLALVGLREGEARMRSLGYNTWLYKYIAFVVSGAFSGAAGGLFGYYNYLISPTHLGVGTSFLPMCMAIIGGVGTLSGPIVGAALIVFVENFASLVTPDRWPLILGGLFVLAIMFARQGVVVYAGRLWNSFGYRYGSIKS